MRQNSLEVVFKAIDVSLEVNKLLFTTVGIMLSAGLAAACWYAGQEFGGGMLPYTLASAAGAVLLFWLVLTIFLGALSKISYECVAAGQHLSWKEALFYAARRVVTLALAPFALLVVVGLLIVPEVVVLLSGRFSFTGELLASVLFLPFVLLNVGAVVAAVFGIWLIFPIIVAEDTGIIGALVRVWQLVRSAPAKVAAYVAMVWAAGVLSAAVILLVVFYALSFTIALTGIGLGAEKSAQILQGVPFVALFPGLAPLQAYLPQTVEAVTPSIAVARIVFSAELLILVVGALAFPVTFLFSSNCAVYIAVRRSEVAREDSREAFEAA